MKINSLLLACALLFPSSAIFAHSNILVFQSDFGLKDGAVSAMKGVSMGIDKQLKIYDVTHEIPPYHIWEAAYRLLQVAEYWPKETVFVSVVDPGVGTDRHSVVLKTKSGHYFVTPDNGTLTLVAEKLGIEEVREIDEAVNRRKNSEKSYTFHGRDVYAVTGAKLASGKITFTGVGKKRPNTVVSLPYQKPALENDILLGAIPALDPQYGNVWSNIDRQLATHLAPKTNDLFYVEIYHSNILVFKEQVPFANSFGDVEEGKNLLYYNSLDNLSIAINMGDFAQKYQVGNGHDWSIKVYR